MQPAGSIDDEDICFSGNGGMYCVIYDSCRVCPVRPLRDDSGISPLAPGLKLLYCSGTESICCSKDDLLALFLVSQCELAGCCCLAGTVNTDHKKDVELAGDRLVGLLVSQDIEHLALDGTVHSFLAVVAGLLDAGLDAVYYLFGCLETAVCPYEQFLEFIQHILIEMSASRRKLGKTAAEEVPGIGKALFECLKYTHQSSSIESILEIPRSAMVTP